MARAENFELDHSTVEAPYVCLADAGQSGNMLVEKYDLRFLQPNRDALPTGVLHTLEHLLAVSTRDELKGITDIPSMGCRTGSYMIIQNQHSPQEIRDALVSVLNKVINIEVVPAVSVRKCGNYKDHSLFAVKEYARIVLDQGTSLDPFKRIL